MNAQAPAAAAESTAASSVPAIDRIGVIGAGQMGSGIAHVCALAGIPVVLLDVQAPALEKALGLIGRNLDRQVNRTLISEIDKLETLARITTSSDYAAFGDCDSRPNVLRRTLRMLEYVAHAHRKGSRLCVVERGLQKSHNNRNRRKYGRSGGKFAR